MTASAPVVRDVRAAAYRVPTDAPEGDGTLTWSSTTAVVVEVDVGETVGLGVTYAHHCCVPLIRDTLAPIVCGRDLLDFSGVWESMRTAIRNLGRPGLVSCALSAVEIAMVDAAARAMGLSLARMLGRVHDEVAVYGSGGFTTYDDQQLREQLTRWTREHRLPAVKIKIGESWGHAQDRDLRRVALARELVGEDLALYVDANGGYSVGEAVRVGERLDQLGVTWFEEPVSSDDLDGLARVRQALGADVTAGEYGYDLAYFARMLDARAVDCVQIDLTRCGGFAEWQRIAALAAARNLSVSGHCAQNFTAHVAVATPNIRHLEWFHDHERLERLLFDGCLDPSGGWVRPDMSIAGHGMTLREPEAEEYRIA